MMKKVLDEQTNTNVSTATTNLTNGGNHCSIKISLISLPHVELFIVSWQENVIRSLRITLDKFLPQNVELKYVYTATILSAKLHIKDKNKN